MDLSPQNRSILPIWILAWVTSAIILADGLFLRAEPLKAEVNNIYLRDTRHDKVCKVHVNILDSSDYNYGYREANRQTCKELSKGQSLQLNRTLLLHRWTSMEDESGKRVTSESLDTEVYRDMMFIALSLVLPLLLPNVRKRIHVLRLRILTAMVPIGIVYYWYSIIAGWV